MPRKLPPPKHKPRRQKSHNTAEDQPRKSHSPLFTRLSQVTPQEIEWHWPDRIPAGEITIVDGDPSTNKSTMMLDLAARTTTGIDLPDGGCARGGVLLLIGEDSINKTVIQRLKAVGADLNRLAIMNAEVATPDSLPEIEAAVVQLGAKLMIVDPFMEYLNGDSHKQQKVRRAMGPLKRFAERTNTAVVLVRHLVKSGGRSPMYRGTGSIGIIAAARSGFLVAPSPDDPHMRVIAQFKNNLGPLAPSLLFEPVSGPDGVVKIEWRGQCLLTAQDLVDKGTCKKLDEAKNHLLALLRDGPQPQKVIEQEAVRWGISYRTVERAKDDLGIVSRRKGFGPGSTVLWELPESEELEEHTPPCGLAVYGD